jgi:hypothetical protein
VGAQARGKLERQRVSVGESINLARVFRRSPAVHKQFGRFRFAKWPEPNRS